MVQNIFLIRNTVQLQHFCGKGEIYNFIGEMLKCLIYFCWNLLTSTDLFSSSSSSCPVSDGSFLRTLASSLIDFNELSSVAALNMLLEVGFFFFTPCWDIYPAGGAVAQAKWSRAASQAEARLQQQIIEHSGKTCLYSSAPLQFIVTV